MKRKGFTLIEIVSAIVIVGIIALITVPTVIRVMNETKKRSFLITAEGVVKAASISLARYENAYDEYFRENEYITFKFSASEGKEGESIDTINGEKIKLSFEGKSPIGGEVNLYKNGDVEVINLTDGTFYVNKDVDTELAVTENSGSLTRKELQTLVEQLQERMDKVENENKSLKEKDTLLEEKCTSQDKKLENLTDSIKQIQEDGNNHATKAELESVSTIVKTNQTNISTNKTNIATNTTNINTNKTNIATNTTNISSLTTKMNGLGIATASSWGVTKAVPSSTANFTVLDTIKFPSKGSYLISVLIHVSAFSNSIIDAKQIGISTQTTGYTNYNDQFHGQNFFATYPVRVGAGTTYYILAKQTSGATQNFTMYINYTRIGY